MAEPKTRVVNLRREAYDVYIGRPGKGSLGPFGNPYRVGGWCSRCGHVHASAEATLACYRAYLFDRAGRDRAFAEHLRALRGKRLGCFCKPGPCHGDVIVEWLDADLAREVGP